MPIQSTKLTLRWVGIFFVLVSAFYLFRSGLADASRESPSGDSRIALATLSPTPTRTPTPFTLLMPNVIRHNLGPRVEVLAALMADMGGNPSEIFLLNERAQYTAQLFNSNNKSINVDMRWTQSGPCGEFVVFNKTISLVPGEQERMVEGVIPNCTGIYSVTVEVTDLGNTVSASTLMVANPPSLVTIETNQGLDKCAVPTISQMQTWWIHSPYWATNMYIGGVSRACDQVNLTPFWMNAVSQQGWSFIPTWVGPQAPCSGFTHRISSNAATAYLEGKDEAEMAASTAVDLGLWGDLVIYYDLEGYSGNTACRNAVASFMKGWVERLHQLGYQAGVYGSPCRSYLEDFSEINPVPDDVWVASWLTPAKYRPDATVWLSGDAEDCLSNSLWASHQRIRQYAGGHVETYGGLSFSIDSNALDGEVTVLPTPTPAPTAQAAFGADSSTTSEAASRPQVRAMQLLDKEAGWALADDRLFITRDSGISWKDLTPPSTPAAHLLDVTFISPMQGWIVRQIPAEGASVPLQVLETHDGGQTWQSYPLIIPEALGIPPMAETYLHFIDDRTGFLSMKLHSGSAFSLGRLFFTQDGGLSWEERSLPLGEPVSFLDVRRGWVAGGPGGDQLFRTMDGGWTWHPQSLPLPFSGTPRQVFVSPPVFQDETQGVLPVTLAGLDPRLSVYTSLDGGETWSLAGQVELTDEPAMGLPFSTDQDGSWWVATHGANRLWSSTDQGDEATQLKAVGLPAGVIALDFLDDQAGWALAQTGVCRGEKVQSSQPTSVQVQPLLCANQTYLLKTVDGGQTWQEISP